MTTPCDDTLCDVLEDIAGTSTLGTAQWAPDENGYVSYADTVRDLIDKLMTMAKQLTVGAVTGLVAAQREANDNVATKPESTAFPFVPNPIEPVVHIPYEAPNMDIVHFQTTYNSLIDQVVTRANEFFTQYFPNEDIYLQDVNDWLVSAINGSVGIDASIEQQMYQRDKDRIEGEYQKAFSEAQNVWASRGFNMPQGTLSGVQFNLRQSADKNLAESSRTIAIKQVELRLENAKFAIQQSITKRQAAIQAAVQYIGALMQGYTNANQFAVMQNDGQAKLIGAASDFYKSRIAVEELKFKSELAEAEFGDKSIQRYQEQLLTYAQLATNAAMEAAKTLGTSAASALNALHTGANLSTGSNSSSSYSQSYNENVSV